MTRMRLHLRITCKRCSDETVRTHRMAQQPLRHRVYALLDCGVSRMYLMSTPMVAAHPQDWLGRPFGSRVSARRGGGWVLLLAPSAELWTGCLRHRTQILYLADISMAVTFMELRPG